jgi:hypothetical protein
MKRCGLLLLFCAQLWVATALVPNRVEASEAPRSWHRAKQDFNDLNMGKLLSPTLETTELRWWRGDDPRYAQRDWDDSAWTTGMGRQIPSHTGIFWLRFRFRDGANVLPNGVYIAGTIAYDFYWDGELIGRSGKPAAREADEEVGAMDNLFSLPENLRGPGEHVVAMRISNYRNGFPAPTMPFTFLAVPLAQYQAFDRRADILPTMAVGAMVLAMTTCLIMWLLAVRHPLLLAAAGTCLAAAITQTLLVTRFNFGYTYDWQYPITMMMSWSLYAVGYSLVVLVILLFDLPRRCWALLWTIPLLSWLMGWMTATRVHLLSPLLLAATLMAAWAVWKKRRGAGVVLVGILITTVLWLYDSRHFANGFFLQDFWPTMLGITSAVALRVRDEMRKARETQLTAARLEIELLKKNLQPHFMLNTLTALTEVIERDPPSAVKLIEDLAEEFRAIARIAGEKQVPLGQELELCRAHLRVISLRTGAKWELATADLDESAAVPPALFLTLIENGLVHQEPVAGVGTFTLQMTRIAGVVRYTFLSPGAVRTIPGRATGGTGLRYVKARLEESFPGQWKLVSRAVANGWQTVIELGASPAARPSA